MTDAFNWVKAELAKMRLFRFPSGHNDLRGAQLALLGEHHDPDQFPLPSAQRKKLRDVWLTQDEHEGRPVILLHALALAEEPVEQHADNLDVKINRLRDKLKDAGIKATFQVNTFANDEKPKNHVQQYTGEYYPALARHVEKFGLSMPGLHSIVMRLEAAPDTPQGHLEKAMEALKEWKDAATLDALRARIRKRVISKRKAGNVVTARIAKRTDAERIRNARRVRAKKEAGQLRFSFMHEPVRRILA